LRLEEKRFMRCGCVQILELGPNRQWVNQMGRKGLHIPLET